MKKLIIYSQEAHVNDDLRKIIESEMSHVHVYIPLMLKLALDRAVREGHAANRSQLLTAILREWVSKKDLTEQP